ncbi:HDOD domain-containing protein [Candidatus Aerophobetes bacterium]|nr:HDOD domain-containing protein [Candidatus Aerophobetes bacterium]
MNTEKNSERIRKTIYNITKLPTLPVITAQLMQLLSNPNASIQKLTNLISQDQSLTTTVLKVVNSSYYGFPRQIATIKHALIILGFNEIRNIVITISVLKNFWNIQKSSKFDHLQFWKHSLGCAVAAGMLAKFFRYRVSGKVFIGGLIHDIGKIVLDQYLHDLFEQVMDRVISRDISFYQAEKEVLGVTHAEIGGWLAKSWNLPLEIEEAIKFHHLPEKATANPPFCSIVHLADVLVRMKSIGSAGDNKIPPIDPSIWEPLRSMRADLNGSHIEYFTGLLEEEVSRARPLFEILGNW